MGATYKLIRLVGISSESVSDAIQNAVTEAAGSVRNLAWYEVKELRGKIQGKKVAEYQVTVDIGFKVES